MKQLTVLFFICIALLSFKADAQNVKTKMDSVSYSVGVLVSQNLKTQGLDDIDVAIFAQAMTDVFKGKDLKVAADQAGKILDAHMKACQSKKFEKNVGEGKKFLDENAKKPGVTVLPSGLQYTIMKPGTGAMPKAGDKIKAHYHGTLIDGTVFDSSVNRGEPFEFTVGQGQVIKGWDEALLKMHIGEKWKIVLPSDLAYGERGAGGSIGPFSTLIFEVELISIN